MPENQPEQVESKQPLQKNFFAKKNKLAIILVLCFFVIGGGGYFGIQTYKTSQYVDKVSPIYRNCEAQGVQLMEMYNKGGVYKTLIADTEKIAGQLKDLKVRLAEIDSTTSKTRVIQSELIKLIDIQINRALEQNSMYRNGLKARIQESVIESLEGNSMLKYYVSDQINKAKAERGEAETKQNASKINVRSHIAEYKEQNKVVADYLGVKIASGTEELK